MATEMLAQSLRRKRGKELAELAQTLGSLAPVEREPILDYFAAACGEAGRVVELVYYAAFAGCSLCGKDFPRRGDACFCTECRTTEA